MATNVYLNAVTNKNISRDQQAIQQKRVSKFDRTYSKRMKKRSYKRKRRKGK